MEEEKEEEKIVDFIAIFSTVSFLGAAQQEKSMEKEALNAGRTFETLVEMIQVCVCVCVCVAAQWDFYDPGTQDVCCEHSGDNPV